MGRGRRNQPSSISCNNAPDTWGKYFPNSDKYITGVGQVITNLHPENNDCRTHGCAVHNPSPSPMDDLPTSFRSDNGMMERVCEHGIGHPDPDYVKYMARQGNNWAGTHGCDGCCSQEARDLRDNPPPEPTLIPPPTSNDSLANVLKPRQ